MSLKRYTNQNNRTLSSEQTYYFIFEIMFESEMKDGEFQNETAKLRNGWSNQKIIQIRKFFIVSDVSVTYTQPFSKTYKYGYMYVQIYT